MKFTFKFHFMRWTNLNFLLLQLLSTLVSVHGIDEHDLYPFSEVLNSGMDNETNPCNNFHQYTCGKWIERNEIPDMSKKWNVYEIINLNTIIKVKDILENPNIDENNEELSVEKKFYEACMDDDYSQKEGDELIEKIIDEIPQTSWQDVVEYFATKLSAFHLFHIKLTESKHLQIERPRFAESNKRSFKDTIDELTDDVKWLYEIGVINYVGHNPSHIDQINESVAFITFINQITYDSNEDIQTVSILELQELYDNYCISKHAKIEWLQFFQKLAEGTGINFTVYDELKVDVQYLEDLCDVLNESPEYAIENYLLYNFVLDEDTRFYFQNNRYEMSYTERYIHCIKMLKITKGITKEIVKLHIPQESQKIVDEIFMNIESAVIEKIENSWLINYVKEIMLHKARIIEYKFALINDPFETKLGKKVTYKFEVGRVAFQNELNLKRAQIINILQVYKEAYKLQRAKRYLLCDACYFRDEDEIVIGVPMMFPTYFYKNAPIGFNYGRMGFTIGHEISHAFGFNILQCFINCIPTKHEREEMRSVLERRKNCFVNEFDSFGTNGQRTLEENVADTQGLKLAWKGMSAVIEDRETKDEGLPDFKDWNQKKLFFLSFANLFCSNPQYREDDGVDEHAPFVIRTLGTLKNMNEFEEIYDCTRNSLSKCDLWSNHSSHYKALKSCAFYYSNLYG